MPSVKAEVRPFQEMNVSISKHVYGNNESLRSTDTDSWHLCFQQSQDVAFIWSAPNKKVPSNTVDSRYLELQWTLKNTSRYPYFDISDLQT